jgi:catechol 2,3-dioxygenase-like lactoylglutathione lyase family enzyme
MPFDPTRVNGPAFVGLGVRDPARSADFYERLVGFKRDPEPFPGGAVAFLTVPIPFAVSPLGPGMALGDRPGAGLALWFKANDAQAVHDKLAAAGVPILAAPGPGPLGGRFGTQFTFADPDGYAITVYDRD